MVFRISLAILICILNFSSPILATTEILFSDVRLYWFVLTPQARGNTQIHAEIKRGLKRCSLNNDDRADFYNIESKAAKQVYMIVMKAAVDKGRKKACDKAELHKLYVTYANRLGRKQVCLPYVPWLVS